MVNASYNVDHNDTSSRQFGAGIAEPLFSVEMVVLLSILNIISCIAGTIGNILVPTIVLLSPILRCIPDIFVVSLSVADLLVTLIEQPMFLYHINAYSKTGNSPFQFAMEWVGYISTVASVTNMFALTVERLISIRFPYKYLGLVTKVRAIWAIGSSWAISIGFGIITMIEGPGLSMWGYLSAMLVVTVAINIYLFTFAQRKRKQIVMAVPLDNAQQTGISKGRILKDLRNKKAAKTVAIIVGTFVLCFLPLLLFIGINANLKTVGTPGFFIGMFWVFTVSMVNSAVNPYVYCIRNQRYRYQFRKLFRLETSIAITTDAVPRMVRPINEQHT